jgi:hypothetical protein
VVLQKEEEVEPTPEELLKWVRELFEHQRVEAVRVGTALHLKAVRKWSSSDGEEYQVTLRQGWGWDAVLWIACMVRLPRSKFHS